jgi:phosphatidylserine/phosphatidylglycerophosphate/cardiolipin synthase-like enzyme
MPQLMIFDAKVMGAFLLAVAAIHGLFVLRRWTHREPTIVTHFSPKGGCAAAIVAELATARHEILVQAYSFTCPDIAKALIAAANRRTKVIVLLDRSNEEETYSELGDLEKHGVEVWIDACHPIAHNKVMVIDKRTVITGSFNFTRQAENQNAENLLIMRDHHDLAVLYRANFQLHREHCHRPGQAPDPSYRTDRGHQPASTPTGHTQNRARHTS